MRAIALLAFALLIGTSCVRRDNGFLRDPKGQPYAWPYLPLAVSMDASLDAYDDSLSSAVAWWNRELGREVFLVENYSGDVTITPGTASAGSTRLYYATSKHGERLRADIRMNYGGDSHGAFRILVHELGHA